MTIRDIARLAKCSIGTVSRVLNDHPDVSDETRQRVMAVVREHQFQPNNNAKHLKQQASKTIAVVVKGSQNMLFAAILEGIQSLLADNDREAAIYYLDEDANEVLYAQQLCAERKPQGILFLGGDLEFFQTGFAAISVPCVLLTNSAAELDFPNLSSITTDDEAASAAVMDLLVRKGHRQIGVVGGNWSSSQISYRRLIGCEMQLKKHRITFQRAVNSEPARYSMKDAYQATNKLLDRIPNVTALFAMSDLMAMGVIRAVHDRGLRVPEDVSVVGYDGVPMAEYLVPRLATVKQDVTIITHRAVELLLKSLSKRPPPASHELAPYSLVRGESVRTISENPAT